jgi:hypothetical protein
MRNAIYVISKVSYADVWQRYRSLGYPIISSWIDDGLELDIDFANAWPRYLSEAANAKFAIIYVAPGEVLKGGLFEAGAALANGAIIYLVGELAAVKTIGHHPNMRTAKNIPQAFAAINDISGIRVNTRTQREAAQWVESTYGTEYLFDVKERFRRFSEEHFELGQAMGFTKEDFIRSMEWVFSRPVGEVHQEIAGCGSTLMTLAEAHSLNLDTVVFDEVQRVKALPVEHFRKKHAAKVAAGISKAPTKFEEAV